MPSASLEVASCSVVKPVAAGISRRIPASESAERQRMKWAMLQPRVVRHADLMVAAARAAGFFILDLTTLTESREDDPREPRDIRHYGPATEGALALAVLRAVCPRPSVTPAEPGRFAGDPAVSTQGDHTAYWHRDHRRGARLASKAVWTPSHIRGLECDREWNGTWCRCAASRVTGAV